jgi:hypothetical protein
MYHAWALSLRALPHAQDPRTHRSETSCLGGCCTCSASVREFEEHGGYRREPLLRTAVAVTRSFLDEMRLLTAVSVGVNDPSESVGVTDPSESVA